jgi:hypothetical protein
MQRLGLVTGLSTPNTSAIKTLNEAELNASNVEALFQGGGNESRQRQWKRKPPP